MVFNLILSFLALSVSRMAVNDDLLSSGLIQQLISDVIDQTMSSVVIKLGERQDAIEKSTEQRLDCITKVLNTLKQAI